VTVQVFELAESGEAACDVGVAVSTVTSVSGPTGAGSALPALSVATV
jgi:hypothetical protein